MLAMAAPLRDAISELPANVEAEQGLLGTILRDNAAYARVPDVLRPEHFSNAVHARIYAAVETLIRRGDLANPVTLHAKFENDAALKAAGGSKYLARLAESAVTLINAVHYARAIVEAARRRELVIACEELTAQALLGTADSDELIGRQRSDLLRIGEIGRATDQTTIIDPAALQGSPIPERPWVCPGWIPDFHVTGISGAGGIGKSLLGQQLCTAAAIGAPWIGQ